MTMYSRDELDNLYNEAQEDGADDSDYWDDLTPEELAALNAEADAAIANSPAPWGL